jgi:hypothetical protein
MAWQLGRSFGWFGVDSHWCGYGGLKAILYLMVSVRNKKYSDTFILYSKVHC